MARVSPLLPAERDEWRHIEATRGDEVCPAVDEGAATGPYLRKARRRRGPREGVGGADLVDDAQTIIARVGATIASTLTIDEVLSAIARQVCEAFSVSSADIHRYSADDRHARLRGFVGHRGRVHRRRDGGGGVVPARHAPELRARGEGAAHRRGPPRRSRPARRRGRRDGPLGRDVQPRRAPRVRRPGDRRAGDRRVALLPAIHRGREAALRAARRAGRHRHPQRRRLRRPRPSRHHRRPHRSVQPPLLLRSPRPGGRCARSVTSCRSRC